ncbi:MAG: NAD(P)/FAD-dependent oxidoreductase [Negativicutes bacterium]
MLPTQADIVIIGGGITGLAIARELSKYTLDVVVLESNPEFSAGSTKANSGICHAGYDPEPGSLKALLNVRGNQLYREIQDDLELPINWPGALIVATSDEECESMHKLRERAGLNGVPVELWTREQVLAKEPNLTDSVICALWAPTGGIMWPFGVALAFGENAARNGVKLFTDTTVTGFEKTDGKLTAVCTNNSKIVTKYIINAAGLYSDVISKLAGDDSFTIKPRKGEYILFDTSVSGFVNTPIFPCPTKVSKGILVSPTTHGNVFIGPDATNLEDKTDVSTSLAGFAEIISGARKLYPNIPLQGAITNFAGLRAAADGNGDFIIRASSVSGMIHAAGIQSPGLSAAPAVAELVVKILGEQGCDLKVKADFQPRNPRKAVFKELNDIEKAELIKINPLYGRVVCRCETITEGEILDAIHNPIGARTVDGVKRRVRAGMGRCQGGFCGPRVVQILARELNVPITEIKKDADNSNLFFEKIPSGEVN